MQYLKQKDLRNYRKIKTPKYCPILQLKEVDWVLDHDHESGQVRAVISSEANVFLGRIERAYKRLSKKAKHLSLADIIRKVADYIDDGCQDIIHPEGFRQLYKRFTRKKKLEQEKILLECGAHLNNVKLCKNNLGRLNLYKTILKL
tara:strand:+ start:451 stop:888 length:438 start_codon:yes stop_codon:yes gene_type:complete